MYENHSSIGMICLFNSDKGGYYRQESNRSFSSRIVYLIFGGSK